MCKYIFPVLLLLLAQQLSAQPCVDITNCPISPVDYCDFTVNDTNLWNESYWLDNANQLNDLSETAVSSAFHFTHNCGGTLTIYYLLFLDLNGDGAQETVVDSRDLPAANTVLYGNGPDAPFDDGTPRAFDERSLPPGEQYRFALEVLQNGIDYEAKLRWNTSDAPLSYVDPQLPYGIHRIRWVAEDSGGEQQTCEYTMTVRDCEPPTVVCLNGLSVNIMPSQMVSLWTVDFLQYMEDNATPLNILEMGIRKAGQGTGFPVDGNGDPVTSLIFDCTQIGTQPVELWARDAAGNVDFCSIDAIITDVFNSCANVGNLDATICAQRWCDGAPISNLSCKLTNTDQNIPPVTLNGGIPGLPDGCFNYSFNTVNGQSYVLSPVLENDVLNGINALDLVRISQHILGTNPLPSPYAIIAGDVNNSNTLTAFDLVQIRNLLLGIYPYFPNANSWEFIQAGYSFSNPLNPFASGQLPQTMTFAANADTTIQFEVIGIKIGDVDCSAIPGVLDDQPDEREPSLLSLPDQFLEKNESVEIVLRNVGDAEWFALQFGLLFDPELVEIEGVAAGELPGAENLAFAQPEPGWLNMVWHQATPSSLAAGTPLLRLRLRALAPLQLHSAIRIAPQGLRPRAYGSTGASRAIALLFGQPGMEAAAVGTAFPNPTTGGAAIPIYLPEAAAVQLQVTDFQGNLVFSKQQNLGVGARQLELPAELFSQSGLYAWQLRVGKLMFSGKVVKQ